MGNCPEPQLLYQRQERSSEFGQAVFDSDWLGNDDASLHEPVFIQTLQCLPQDFLRDAVDFPSQGVKADRAGLQSEHHLNCPPVGKLIEQDSDRACGLRRLGFLYEWFPHGT